VSRPTVPHSSNPPRPAFADEIRRDAGFDGRDAHATLSKTRHKAPDESGALGTRPSEDANSGSVAAKERKDRRDQNLLFVWFVYFTVRPLKNLDLVAADVSRLKFPSSSR
jgi:hypothetical protein